MNLKPALLLLFGKLKESKQTSIQGKFHAIGNSRCSFPAPHFSASLFNVERVVKNLMSRVSPRNIRLPIATCYYTSTQHSLHEGLA